MDLLQPQALAICVMISSFALFARFLQTLLLRCTDICGQRVQSMLEKGERVGVERQRRLQETVGST